MVASIFRGQKKPRSLLRTDEGQKIFSKLNLEGHGHFFFETTLDGGEGKKKFESANLIMILILKMSNFILRFIRKFKHRIFLLHKKMNILTNFMF